MVRWRKMVQSFPLHHRLPQHFPAHLPRRQKQPPTSRSQNHQCHQPGSRIRQPVPLPLPGQPKSQHGHQKNRARPFLKEAAGKADTKKPPGQSLVTGCRNDSFQSQQPPKHPGGQRHIQLRAGHLGQHPQAGRHHQKGAPRPGIPQPSVSLPGCQPRDHTRCKYRGKPGLPGPHCARPAAQGSHHPVLQRWFGQKRLPFQPGNPPTGAAPGCMGRGVGGHFSRHPGSQTLISQQLPSPPPKSADAQGEQEAKTPNKQPRPGSLSSR